MQFLAVIEKDIRSELRTRYGLTALALFVVTSVALVAFSAADEPLPKPIAAGVLWVIMFFTALTGMARAFVHEEERGTWLFLRISTRPTDIYMGKLAVNTVLSVTTNCLTALLFVIFLTGFTVGSPWILVLCVAVGSIGLAAVLTIVSAIVAKAGSKNSLLPVLSFPLLVPLLLPGTNALLMSVGGFEFTDVLADLSLMLAYSGIVSVVAWIIFPIIWCD
ncbi:MAG: heme exporter protein CcmB [Ignavibacteria bacterium]|nr:heme exporter protein CcmB [Ignavibacteria bacterium]